MYGDKLAQAQMRHYAVSDLGSLKCDPTMDGNRDDKDTHKIDFENLGARLKIRSKPEDKDCQAQQTPKLMAIKANGRIDSKLDKIFKELPRIY